MCPPSRRAVDAVEHEHADQVGGRREQATLRAEGAAASGLHYAQALLDLVKAFERLPHELIVQAAARLGYCLRALRLSLAAYRIPRVLGADGAYSRTVVAVLGITAGSGFATTELRVLLHEVVTDTRLRWPQVTISLYVDDTKWGAVIRGERDRVRFQESIDRLENWSREWQLLFNVSKCKIMHGGRQNAGHSYTMGGGSWR